MSRSTSPPLRQRLAACAILCGATLIGTWPVFSRPWRALYDPAPGVALDLARFVSGDVDQAASARNPPGRVNALDLIARSDTLLSVWTLAWGAHALATAPARFYDANTLFPTPRALTYSDHQLGVLPWFAPTYWLTDNPVLAYQLALFLSAVTCGFLFYVLVDRWTFSPAAGVAAGVVSILAPFHLETLRVLLHYAIPYIPAALLCVDGLLAGRRPLLAAVGLTACLTLQAACSVYMVYTSFLLVPAYALGSVLESRCPRKLVKLVQVGFLCTLAAALVVVIYRPYLAHAASGLYRSDQGGTAPRLLLFERLLPGVVLRQLLAGSLGLPLLLVAALGLLHRGARRRWTALGLVVLGAALSLGPTLRLGSLTFEGMPAYWLGRWVPGFATQRHSYAPRMLVGIGLVCLLGLGWGWLLERLAGARPVVRRAAGALMFTLLAVALSHFVIRRPQAMAIATGARVPEVYRWLAAHGGGAPLLELPNPFGWNSAYAYFSTYHWLPLFNGGFAIPPPGYADLSRSAGDVLDADRAAAFLQKVPVTWVLVHGALLFPKKRAALEELPPHLEKVMHFGTDVLLRVRRPAASQGTAP